MSRMFGGIHQNGYVVENLDAALAQWVDSMGVGPFFKLGRLELEYYVYRGEPSPLEVAVAVGFAGSLQIELIQQLNHAPSHYRDFIARHGYGLQHLGVFVDDYDATIERMERANLPMAVRGKVRNGPRFAYFETGPLPGTMLEIADNTSAVAAGYAMMHELAASWTGEEPVRRFSASLTGSAAPRDR